MGSEGGLGIVKEPEEMEQFFHNLGIEYRFSCFSEKSPEGCYLLGDFMEAIKKDFPKAGTLYKDSCEEYKYGKSCNKYGSYLFTGKGCTKSLPEALNYFKMACSLGSGEGCYHAGQMLTGGDPGVAAEIKADPIEAVKCLEKGCDKKIPDSCFQASSIYIFGSHGIAKNMTKAFEISVKACEDWGHFESCNNAYQMYSRGEGVEKNPKKAAEYKAKLVEMIEDAKRGTATPMSQFTE